MFFFALFFSWKQIETIGVFVVNNANIADKLGFPAFSAWLYIMLSPVILKLLEPIVGIKPKKVTLAKLLQILNALIPILVTEEGIVIDVKPVQPLNAFAPILVTELGIVIDVKPVQP